MDTGGSGTPVFSYTAMFGNGLSGTLGLEDYTEQALPVVPVSTAFGNNTLRLSTDIGNNRGNWVPDIVGNLRVDQAWGFAQISAAAHQDAAQYYPTNFSNGATGFGSFTYPANTTLHPGDAWGWAIGAGIQLNVPTGVGDVVSFAGNYCHGASRYCSNPAGGVRGAGNLYNERNGHTIGFGNLSDAYYNAAGGNLELPNAWNFEAGFAHHWDAKWQTSLYGGYLKYEANSNAVDTLYCPAPGNAGAIAGYNGPALGPGCRDWSAWQVGSRTLWNPVPNLDISVDIIYHRINSALKGGSFTSAAAGLPTGNLTFGDVSEWSGVLRFQRNFWP
jgi:hypothetical protein